MIIGNHPDADTRYVVAQQPCALGETRYHVTGPKGGGWLLIRNTHNQSLLFPISKRAQIKALKMAGYSWFREISPGVLKGVS